MNTVPPKKHADPIRCFFLLKNLIVDGTPMVSVMPERNMMFPNAMRALSRNRRIPTQCVQAVEFASCGTLSCTPQIHMPAASSCVNLPQCPGVTPMKLKKTPRPDKPTPIVRGSLKFIMPDLAPNKWDCLLP